MKGLRSLADLLREVAERHPEGAVHFPLPDGSIRHLTYPALLAEATRYQPSLAERVPPEGPVLLLLSAPGEFLPLFWGCQLAGRVPVPLLPPRQVGDGDEVRRLRGVWQKLHRPPVVTEEPLVPVARALLSAASGSADREPSVVLAPGALRAEVDARSRPHRAARLGLIQFTSGSTRAPRGVCLSQANLLANIEQMVQRAPLDPTEVELGWMPHTHDMGLIGCHLAPLRVGAQQYRMLPTHFLRRPADWLDLASRARATLLTGTETALRLLLRRVPEVPAGRFDLSAVRHFFVGAEPISPATLAAVADRLAPAGLDPGALRVAYGLAEASVGVAFAARGEPRRVWHLHRQSLAEGRVVAQAAPGPETLSIPEIGPPFEGVAVRVVDDRDAPLPEDRVGHIQIQGPNVTEGYYEDDEATRETRSGSWWRTGDLGFLHEGALTVCGRVKETLYAAGRTLHAHDLEAVAAELDGVRRAVVTTAAAGAAAAGEQVVLFVVPEANAPPGVGRAAAVRIAQICQVPVDHVVTLDGREIPRTSSGKVRRFRLGERFAAGDFAARAEPVSGAPPASAAPESSAAAAPGTQGTAAPAPGPKAAVDLPRLAAHPEGLSQLVAWVRQVWAAALERAPEDIDPELPFLAQGGSSVAAYDVLGRLEEGLGRPLDPDLLRAHATVRAQAEALLGLADPVAGGRTAPATAARGTPHRPNRGTGRQGDPAAIAVVGLACRLPGADSPEALYRLLRAGEQRIGPIPPGRFPAEATARLTCRAGAFLEAPYDFDAALFGLADAEAAVLDPQQRILLELAREALETAGLAGARRPPSVGVFVGANQLAHAEALLRPQLERDAFERLCRTEAFAALPAEARAALRASIDALAPRHPLHPSTAVGNLLNMLAARIAQEMDFTGPAWAVDTACSASLVAVHQACEALRAGHCQLALAAGVHLNLTATAHLTFEAAGALSPTGQSRPFAATADGFVPGEGAGLVLLRPLADALAAGDPIYAVIRGSAVNNDGRSLGPMAPHPAGQQAVVEAAWQAAGRPLAAAGLIEAHGTGTPIGDPVELRALDQVLHRAGAAAVPVGSIKANLGHLLGAAGIAGLLKAVLSLHRSERLPSPGADPEHPALREARHLRLQRTVEPWPGPGRLAGVSAFGFGGTNCHVVLEAAPETAAAAPARPDTAAGAPSPYVLLPASAPTAAHLEALGAALSDRLAASALPEAAWELARGRPAAPCRAAAVVDVRRSERLEPLAALGRGAAHGALVRSPEPVSRPLRIAFLYPGQGTLGPGPARGLVATWPGLRGRLNALLEAAGRPELAAWAWGDSPQPDRIAETAAAQPLLVALQIALTEALADIGLAPVAVLGHSLGELSACAAAGALPAEEAVRLAARRGALMGVPEARGAMLAVALGPAATRARLSDHAALDLAADNGPGQTVVSGPEAAIAALEQALEAEGVAFARLQTGYAFHTRRLGDRARADPEPLRPAHAAPPAIPLLSTVTGARLDTAPGQDHFVRQVGAPVAFASALKALARLAVDAFVDIGPGRPLVTITRQTLGADDPRPVVPLGRRADAPDPDADWRALLEGIAALWVRGAPVRFAPPLADEPRRRPVLPATPRLPRRHGGAWESAALDRAPPPAVPAGAEISRKAPEATAAAERDSLAPWLYQEDWAPVDLPPALPRAPRSGCILFAGSDRDGLDGALAERLASLGVRVVRARPGGSFTRTDEDCFTCDPRDPRHWRWICESVAVRAAPLRGVVLWDALWPRGDAGAAERLLEASRAVVALDQALLARRQDAPLWLVLRGAAPTGIDDGSPDPVARGLAALALARFAERPARHGGVVDLGTAIPADAASWLVRLLDAPGRGRLALRAGGLLAPRLSPLTAPPAEPDSVVRPDAEDLGSRGVLAVLGGSGAVGRVLGARLAEALGPGTHLALAGTRPETDMRAALEDLAARGRSASYHPLRLPHRQQLARWLAALEAQHGPLRGVVHAITATPEPSSLDRRDETTLAPVIRSKLGTAEDLAALLEDRPEVPVLLVSSVAGTIPSLGAGVADYAAANAALDALAAAARQRGAPWRSVAYTLWASGGHAVGIGALAPPGVLHPVPSDLGAEAGAMALSAHSTRLPAAVVMMAPEDLRAVALAPPPPPDADATEPQSDASAPAASADSTSERGAAPRQSAVISDLASRLRESLSEALDVPPDAVDPDAPFQSLGLTSLAAVDLTRELEAHLGRRLTPTLLFEHNTLNRLLAHLQGREAAQADPRPAAALPAAGTDAAAPRAYSADSAQPTPDPAADGPTAPAATSDTPEAELPLLRAQETFYANQRFFPHLPGYVFLGLDLSGPMDPGALAQAVRLVHARHEPLRARFGWRGDRVVQRLGGVPAPQLAVHDLGAEAADRAAGRLWDLERTFRNTVLDLDSGPLWQVALCRLGPERHRLLVNLHHIVADAWSAQIVALELLTLHGQLRAGAPAALPPLQSRFADVAAALAAEESSRAGAESRAYWRRVLDPPPAPLALPWDGDPAAEPTGPCGLHLVRLSPADTRRFAARARQWSLSPFELLTTSYLLALHHWSRAEDILIRAAHARRLVRLPGLARVVGSFADSLPLRVAVRPEDSLDELQDAVRAANLGAQRHPFTSSMELAGLGGHRAHLGPRGISPAGISFPDFSAATQVGGLRVIGMRGGAASGFTQLGLIAWTFADQLHLSWNFHEPLLRPDTVARLAEEHQRLLAALVRTAEPGDRVQHLVARALPPVPDPPPPEAQPDAPGAGQATPEAPPGKAHPARWAATALPPGQVVHRRILARVERAPDRPAVITPRGVVSYGALGDDLLRLARALQEHGVHPRDRVGVLAHPGLGATRAVLGVLASGATYVPLPPADPDARLAALARDAGLEVLVVDPEQAGRLAAFAETPVRAVLLADTPEGAHPVLAPDLPPGMGAPTPWESIAMGPPLRAVPGDPDHLAYVMYTSGTTGRPKGVMVRHRAVSLFHDWVHDAFGVRPEDRFIQTSALSFGGSIRQLYSPLLAGARLYPAPPALPRDPEALVGFLEAHRITLWNSVPTLWMRLLEAVQILDAAGRPVTLADLRWILVGGEYVPARCVRRWRDRFGDRHRIANLYGSTETVVNATWYEVRGRPRDGEKHTPIGRARKGSEVYLLDAEGQPVPEGTVGEIVVGGPSLADGYLNAPEETARAFVRIPGLPGTVYRTGDLATRLPDGNLVYLGRRDSQVKVRGNRVELQEIEATLLSHPAVEAAAVVEHSTAERQWLVGFYVCAPQAAVSPAALRAHLAAHLPDFMVPHRLETCDALPLTGAGKVDRRALRAHLAARHGPAAPDVPAPEPGSPEPQPPRAGPAEPDAPPQPPAGGPPRTPTERIVAAVWRDVLEVERVDRDDDFFALGGDSILALTVLRRLAAEVPVLPRPITLYAKRRLHALAAELDRLAETARQTGDSPGRDASQQPHPEPAHALADTPAQGTGPVAPVDPPAPQAPPPGPGVLPLTPTQESFLLSERLWPDRSPVFCARIPVQGRIDAAHLRQALALLTARHGLLRTVFESAGARTWQRLLPLPSSVPLSLVDLRAQEAAAAEAEVRRRFAAETGRRLDPGTWPLWRVSLLRRSEAQADLLLTVHHAIADGWSLHQLGTDLLAAYDALCDGRPPELPPLASTWSDVVAHLQQMRAAPDAAALAYWRNTFADPWPSWEFPTADARHEAGPSPSRRLPADALAALRATQRRAGASLYVGILTAWLRVLARHTGRAEGVLGTALSGRDLPLPDIAHLFGPLTTVVPLRIRLGDPESPFARDLEATQRAMDDATAHAHLPADVLLGAIPRHPGLPWPPGREVFFSFMEFSALPAARSRHLQVAWDAGEYYFAAQAAGSALLLGAQVTPNGLRLTLHGAAPRDLRTRLLADLEAALQDPESPRRGPRAREVPPPEPAASPLAAVAAGAARTTTASEGSTAGGLRQMDAAILAYLPDPDRLARLSGGRLSPEGIRDLVRERRRQGAPATWVETRTSRLGATGAFLLHRFASELDTLPPEALAEEVAAAVRLARTHGAHHVSLAGLLPARTGYGLQVKRHLPASERAGLTTGHAATVVAVVQTVETLLARLGRPASEEHLAVVGFGAIGQTALALLLARLGTPRRVLVCDRATQARHLEAPLTAARRRLGDAFAFAPSTDGRLPEPIYRCSLLIGAASAGGLLEVERLAPGALLVDDSFPLLADPRAAWERMDQHGDVAVVAGGLLDVAAGPPQANPALPLPPGALEAAGRLLGRDALPGCRAEPLLRHAAANLPAVLGLPDPDVVVRYHQAARALGVRTGPLQLAGRRLSRGLLDRIARRQAPGAQSATDPPTETS